MKILILAVALLSPLVATATEEIKTPYGTLKATEIPAQNTSNFAITLDGKEVGKIEADLLSLHRVTSPADAPAYIIISKELSGLHCRHEFALVKVSSATEASISGSFGNCMELAGAALISDGVKISLRSPTIEGRQPDMEEWTWQAGVLTNSSAAGKFLAYINNKYNFSVDYPASFSGHGEPDAGDGQVFTSPANDARLTASATYCGEGLYSPARFLADHQQNSALKVTYSRQTKTLAVVSGTRGNRIFYDKLIFNGVQCAKFSLEYESTQREQYDALVARIAASLKQWSD